MDENKDGLQPADPQLPGRGSAGSYPGRRLQKESTARRLWRDYGFAPITVAVMLVLLKVILQGHQGQILGLQGSRYSSG